MTDPMMDVGLEIERFPGRADGGCACVAPRVRSTPTSIRISEADLAEVSDLPARTWTDLGARLRPAGAWTCSTCAHDSFHVVVPPLAAAFSCLIDVFMSDCPLGGRILPGNDQQEATA